MSSENILHRMQRYCAYQERCHKEVRTKLLQYKVYGSRLEELMVQLIEDDFLNEERFAKAYARGKFRIKKWGKVKIVRELTLRKISAFCITEALKEIDASDYEITMKKVIQSALKKYLTTNQVETQYKAAQYTIQRGFESDLVWQYIRTSHIVTL